MTLLAPLVPTVAAGIKQTALFAVYNFRRKGAKKKEEGKVMVIHCSV